MNASSKWYQGWFDKVEFIDSKTFPKFGSTLTDKYRIQLNRSFMAPRVELFLAWKTIMKIIGLDSPFPSFPQYITTIWKWIMLYGNAHYILVTAWAVIYGSVSFTEKMEVVLLLMAGFPFVYQNFLFAIRKKRLYALTDRIDDLVESVEKEYGPDVFVPGRKICKTIMIFYSTQFSVVMLSACSVAYYQYYFLGDKCAIPFAIYTPFDRENHFHLTQIHLFVVFTACGAGLVMSNTFMGTMTVLVTTLLDKIRNQLRQLGPNLPEQTMRRIIRWHTELIFILGETNSLLGTGYVVDYLASTGHICFSGFILMKSSSETGVRIFKNIALCLACFVLPLFYCCSGHLIKSANEAVYGEIFKNDWLSLTPKQRKDLLLPALLVKKGLCLRYKGLVECDLSSYFKIVKQSYSFLTVLMLMDQRMVGNRQ